MFSKIGVLKNSQISQKTSMLESLFNTAAAFWPATLLKETPSQAFSCEYGEIFKNIYDPGVFFAKIDLLDNARKT